MGITRKKPVCSFPVINTCIRHHAVCLARYVFPLFIFIVSMPRKHKLAGHRTSRQVHLQSCIRNRWETTSANASDTQHPIPSKSRDVGSPELFPSTSRQFPGPFHPRDSSDSNDGLQPLATSSKPCSQQAPGSDLVNPRSVHAELSRTLFSDVQMASRVTEEANMVTTSIAMLKQILTCVRCMQRQYRTYSPVLFTWQCNPDYMLTVP